MNRLHAELRAAEVTGNTLAGHAAVFGQLAEIRGGWEAIAPGAFDEVLGRQDDVVALRDHDPAQLLGRSSAGTLRLSTDDDGLAFEVDLPDTSYARDVRELVGRGDLRGASFGFLPGRDELGPGPDGRQLRTHTSVKRLLDVSVVAMPAYDGTSVTLRSYQPPALDNRTRLILARHRARTARR
jgi:uncharacterized protein